MPATCPTCEYVARDACDLRKHCARKHKDAALPAAAVPRSERPAVGQCHLCEYRARDRHDLRKHVVRRHCDGGASVNSGSSAASEAGEEFEVQRQYGVGMVTDEQAAAAGLYRLTEHIYAMHDEPDGHLQPLLKIDGTLVDCPGLAFIKWTPNGEGHVNPAFAPGPLHAAVARSVVAAAEEVDAWDQQYGVGSA